MPLLVVAGVVLFLALLLAHRKLVEHALEQYRANALCSQCHGDLTAWCGPAQCPVAYDGQLVEHAGTRCDRVEGHSWRHVADTPTSTLAWNTAEERAARKAKAAA